MLVGWVCNIFGIWGLSCELKSCGEREQGVELLPDDFPMERLV